MFGKILEWPAKNIMVCNGIFSSVELYQLQSARISGMEYLLKYKLLITSAYTFQSKNMA